MATSQTQANKAGLSLFAEETASGSGIYGFPIGGITLSIGTNAPTHAATKGSLYIELGGPDLYQNTDGSTTWEKVGVQT